MPPPPSNHRKLPAATDDSPALARSAHPPQPHKHTRRPVRREKRQESHPPVTTHFFLDVQERPAPRLSAASIIPIAPSVRQSTVSDLDDVFRCSPVAPDVPALPVLPAFHNPAGAPLKPTEAERYKQKYLNRRTLPPPAHSGATGHRGRARTQSLGSVSSSSTSTGEPQRSTTAQHHYHKRTPSNQTLQAIEERPLPALPRRILIPAHPSRDPPSNTHVHFTTTQPSKSVPHTSPSDPPRTSDDSRSPTTQPSTTTTTSTTSPNTMSGSPTSTLVHPSPLQERQPSPTKPPKKRMFPPLHFFKRDRSASVGCPPSSTDTTPTTNSEHQKRPTTPTPSKFSSLPSISTSRISRPIMRSTSTSTPMPRHWPRHHGEMSAVKRGRRVTPLTEVDMYSKKNWRSSIMEERKVPEYNPPADSPYAPR